MKISIHNFKTIKDLVNLDIRPLNIISGANSSGKTSLIQFILMLKQTIGFQAVNRQLILNGNSIKLGCYNEVVYCKDTTNDISVEISFLGSELNSSELDYLKITECRLEIIFTSFEENAILKSFQATYFTPSWARKEHWINIKNNFDDTFSIQTNTAIFSSEIEQLCIENGGDPIVGELLFTSIMPQYFVSEIKNPNFPDIDKNPTKRASQAIKLKRLDLLLQKTFSDISYIGPLREEPKNSYSANKNDKKIGNKGEYAAFIFEREATNKIDYFKIETDEKGIIKYIPCNGQLAEAVKYWICDVFNLAKNIYAQEYKDEFVIKVVNHYGIESTIKHVGFGISQILPIVLEGLRMEKGCTLILEQPEIHLHPKVQGQLFDFLYSLTLLNKKFIIETHSDHFITRMRRRVVEDLSNILADKINLLFIEQGDKEHVFIRLNMTDLGSLSYFPKDFADQIEVDYRAIVKAQAIKRQKKSDI